MRNSRWWRVIRLVIACTAGLSLPPFAMGQTAAELRTPAPELVERTEEEWINSKPLKLADLRGEVVVVHFWTFGCINCIHNQPHYKSWHKKYSKKGVTIIGVHTPETEGERDIEAVRKSAAEKGLEYPIVIDGDAAMWKAWGTQWWPTTYLIDKHGNVRYRWDGELNWKKNKGEALLRRKIDALLAEPAPKVERKPAVKAAEDAEKPDEQDEGAPEADGDESKDDRGAEDAKNPPAGPRAGAD